jgi:hypothetical protein
VSSSNLSVAVTIVSYRLQRSELTRVGLRSVTFVTDEPGSVPLYGHAAMLAVRCEYFGYSYSFVSLSMRLILDAG